MADEMSWFQLTPTSIYLETYISSWVVPFNFNFAEIRRRESKKVLLFIYLSELLFMEIWHHINPEVWQCEIWDSQKKHSKTGIKHISVKWFIHVDLLSNCTDSYHVHSICSTNRNATINVQKKTLAWATTKQILSFMFHLLNQLLNFHWKWQSCDDIEYRFLSSFSWKWNSFSTFYRLFYRYPSACGIRIWEFRVQKNSFWLTS